jgi:hypothetical protein
VLVLLIAGGFAAERLRRRRGRRARDRGAV